ncbi:MULTISPECIES: hypothetical protein [Peptoniphilus]|uniref:hypothetical protein n=1 Tax=Peptoniphilus TaxID=162289 RepID=UPI00031ACF3C|nr:MULTISPECIES: hypothetical protein [Peptoniphilus]
MKETIESIIDIDNRTEELVKQTDLEEERLREELRKKLTDMESKANNEAKIKAQEIFDKIISEAGLEVERRKLENSKRLKKIDENYENNKDYLIEKAFDKIILSKDD